MKSTYERFIHFTFVGIIHVINLLFGLAIGGVMGHWFMALPVFLIGDHRRGRRPAERLEDAELCRLRALFPDLRVHRACRTNTRPAGRRECELP